MPPCIGALTVIAQCLLTSPKSPVASQEMVTKWWDYPLTVRENLKKKNQEDKTNYQEALSSPEIVPLTC